MLIRCLSLGLSCCLLGAAVAANANSLPASSVDDSAIQNMMSSSSATSTASSSSSTCESGVFFVQQTDNASLSSTVDGDGCRTLTVWPVVSNLHYFSNEPERLAGSLNPADFVAAWTSQTSSDGVSEFKPNAALLGVRTVDGAEENYSRSATLSNPVYDAANAKMTYTACPITGDTLPAITNLQHAVLFIDTFIATSF